MLSDRARAILFWFTISMIIIVAVVAVVAILRACSGLIQLQEEPAPAVSPGEISLCPGEQHQFVVAGGVEVTWGTTGGTISESGLFTAGNAPGDYTVTVTGSGLSQATGAIVHIVACTPTPTSDLPPTLTSAATATATIAPPPASIPTATPMGGDTTAPVDPQGDVGAYDTGVPVESPPAGVDIRTASVGADLRVTLQPTARVPAELSDWVAEGDALLWISLHSPVPDPPAVYAEWLFVLDVDGDTGTGRPAGSARINPDLGPEVAVGVRYDVGAGEYTPYLLVWDPAQGGWIEQSETPRFFLNESHTLIGLALPLETLTQTVAQTAGVTLAPEAVKGRAAALSYVGEQTVIDFYPDRPE